MRYRLVTGEVLDLDGLRPQEAAFLDRALDLFRSGADSRDFTAFMLGAGNPLAVAAKRFPDGVMWHPLTRALHDLEYRLSIAQGKRTAAPGEDLSRDPVGR